MTAVDIVGWVLLAAVLLVTLSKNKGRRVERLHCLRRYQGSLAIA